MIWMGKMSTRLELRELDKLDALVLKSPSEALGRASSWVSADAFSWASHAGLAGCLRVADRMPEARKELALACEIFLLTDPGPLAEAQLMLRLGRYHCDRKESVAADYFRRAVYIYNATGDVSRTLLAEVEIVATAFQLGNEPAETADAARWLAENPRTPAAAAFLAWQVWCLSAAGSNRMTEIELDHARHRMVQARPAYVLEVNWTWALAGAKLGVDTFGVLASVTCSLAAEGRVETAAWAAIDLANLVLKKWPPRAAELAAIAFKVLSFRGASAGAAAALRVLASCAAGVDAAAIQRARAGLNHRDE